jgi:hypothetical protein
MVRKRMLRIISPRETSQIAVVTESKRNKWRYLNNIKREASRHFRNKKENYLKDKINELAANSKNKNIRDLYREISDFMKGHHSRIDFVNVENGDLFAGFQNILNRWKNCFSQLLNVHIVSDVSLIEIYTADSLVSNPGPFVLDVTTAILKSYKSSNSSRTDSSIR